jgi:hypothetical protein
MLLTHVPDRYRGRVFTTVEGLLNATMLLSLTAASIAVQQHPIRAVATVAGSLSASTAVFWAWAVFRRKLPEPIPEAIDTTEPEPAKPTNPA